MTNTTVTFYILIDSEYTGEKTYYDTFNNQIIFDQQEIDAVTAAIMR
jgi:hypothetical protein